jgi:flagellar hook protein FlgE
MDPIATAQYGMLAASRRFEASAGRVAQMGVAGADVDLTGEIVEQITAKHAFSANAAVIRTTEDMAGDLLNIVA